MAVAIKEFTSKLSSIMVKSREIQRIGLAVSGGADSMALCVLLAKHRENEGWPQSVFAYTIDHGVRLESSKEAKTVGELVTSMGFSHRVVKLSPAMQSELNKQMPGDLETVLRTERFALLSNAAKEDSVGTILTGHHQDDQYETVLQRLAWGSTLAGLGGIPPKNGFFRRPLLEYPKERLRATCEQYNIQWMDDPTNSDPTYALRNAIRQIVKVQDNLPAALQKENILALAARGNQFRDDLLDEVNNVIRQCKFSYEPFNGILRVECPNWIYNLPHRILQHFIPALSRIFNTLKLERFYFHGVGNDKASKRVVEKFLNPKMKGFNVIHIQYRRQAHAREDMFELRLLPEEPRRSVRNKFHVPVKVSLSQTGEWRLTSFEFPPAWKQFSDITVKVREDRGYYFRYLDKNVDFRLMEKHLSKRNKIRWKNALRRSKWYPLCLFAVLCHKEGRREWVDAIPQLRLHLSDDVVTTSRRTYNLDEYNNEWVGLKWDRTERENLDCIGSDNGTKRR